MKKSTIYNCLMEQSSEWIKLSLTNPSKHMPKSVILLHWLVLKKRGLLCLETQVKTSY